MTLADIMKDMAKGGQIVVIAEDLWKVIEGDHVDSHALGQALIEAGQELQGNDPVVLK